MKLIFVGGFYGVGKSTLCAAAAERFGIEHRSASSLIREMDPESIPAQGKEIRDLDGNQRLLVARVRQLEAQTTILLLDGHYGVAVKNKGFEVVPLAVFSALQPSALIHVWGEPELIHQQLTDRDGASAWNEGEVHRMQTADLGQARNVAIDLKIDLYEIRAGMQEDFSAFVAEKARVSPQ